MTNSKAIEKNLTLKTNDEELENLIKLHRTVIKVMGTGGAGNNTITRLGEAGIQGVETIAVNTDAQDLLYTKSDNKLLIGKNITKGLGAGSDPQIGEEAARENEKEIKAFIEGADIVFITCGLGGGTGTGSAPIIAEIAKDVNALTIAVVTTPFNDEGGLKLNNAASGLERLRKTCDTVIVIKNDRLLDLVPDLPLNAAFKFADEILVNAVKGITELITKKGLVNLDFADIKTVMKDGDTAMIGIGEGESENKVQDAIEKAVNNPLLDIDITGARSALINIEGDESLTISEARNVMVAIAQRLDPDAKIVWGANINETLKGKIRILIIATGLNADQQVKEKAAKQEKSITPSTMESEFSVPVIEEELEPTSEPLIEETSKSDNNKSVRLSKNVFNQIFEDEIKGDLNILKESIKFLEANKVDTKTLRNIKNAALGIKNVSQLYSNKNVEDLATFIGDLFELLLAKKIKFDATLLPLLNKTPQIFEGMVAGYTIAVDDANQVIKEMSKLMDKGGKKVGGNKKNKAAKISNSDDGSNADEDLKIDKIDLENSLKMELN